MKDQAHKLRQQFSRIQHHTEAKTIAVASGKGGVGKSNFVLNFALTLTEKSKKVLIFDLDIGMGNIDILLGLHPKKSIVDLFEENTAIHEIIEHSPYGLAYIAAGSGLASVFQLDDAKMEYFFHQLQLILNDYDYIFFDMGAGVTNHSLAFVLAADEAIIVTTPEPTAITDGYAMIKHIMRHPGSPPIYIVMNRVSSHKVGEQTMNRLQQVVSRFLYKQIYPLGLLPDDSIVSKAVIQQIPFTKYREHAKVSKRLRGIVSNYLGYIAPKQKEQRNFVTKLKQLIRER
ncbi:MinD/ParA family protein [Pontibacillus litoralis]|uniref:AAA domain-containing protein n=1 Tax=Pontibacillus litoralis JSM 072002 TaxID=1385512 RepID=A0A0A5G8P4_9BACI|nr:MinD/ParA family protein [Pontibacillus litoralis]KGX88429.1 hypothetical protein N784_07120 [Pontibacillus litoralis JSM 072002]